MDYQKEETLIDIGLTKNETRVYLSLLKLGTATAAEITKESKVHRVNVYDALERLRAKGLISSIIKAKKRIFEAANPEQLQKILAEKEELLNQIMPSLSQEFKMKKEKQQVHHFFGPEGVMQAYYMMLEQKEPLYALGGSGLNRKYLKHRHTKFIREWLAAGGRGKALYYEFTRGDREKGWEGEKRVETRYIPDKFKTPCMVDICGDLVINLLPIEDNIMAIVIENRALADSYRQFFNFMWEHAKP